MYPSDLKDKEWEQIRQHFEYSNGYGNQAVHPRRSLVNGILYVVKTGCQWRMLPRDFPPWQTVYGYFRRLSRTGVWERVLAELVKTKRLKSGRNEHPTLLIIDAQSVKNVGKGGTTWFRWREKKSKDESAKSSLILKETCIKCWFTKPISMIQKEVLF